MGYRSDVSIGFLFESAEAMAGFVAAMKLLGDKQVNNALEDYEVLPDVHLLYVSFDSVKWYESYEDVRSHETLLREARERGIPNVFVRVGEDTNDIEYENHNDDAGELYDYFRVSRTIECPSGGERFLKGESDEPERQSTAGATQCEPVDGKEI